MKRTWFFLIAGLAVVLSVGVLVQIVAAADVDVIISEVMFNPNCGANNGTGLCGSGTTDETQFEWVEVYNRGATSVNLTGWQICDESPGVAQASCDILTGVIGSNEYWLIGVDNDPPTHVDLIAELNNYGATLNTARTIFLITPMGSNGLANGTGTGGDAVFLVTAQSNCGAGSAACVSDCVSWDNTNTCAALIDGTSRAYLTGANGVDNTALSSNEGQGQSIVNVQGTWSLSGPGVAGTDNQTSPYTTNIAVGGSPTAVTLNTFTANTAPFPIAAALAAFGLIAVTSGLTAARRKKQNVD